MKKSRARSWCRWWFLLACAVSTAHAQLAVRDDAGRLVELRAPAQRIVSLAPNITELLYAAGAGNRIVGAVEYSDYPEAAKRLPRVGSGAGLDLEAIAARHPDLVIAWQTGNPARQVEQLRDLGFTVFVTEPRRMEDIAGLLERFGRLAGTPATAGAAAAEYRRHLARLRARYAARPKVPVFYQILDAAPLTVSGRHLIGDVLRLCGGENVFAGLPGITPRVDVESVLQRNPEVILASGEERLWPEWRERWQAWPGLAAVRDHNLFFISPDVIERGSPRILDGAEDVCRALEQARTGHISQTSAGEVLKKSH
jgi:iron complex transport system substrate-binding protein